MALNLKFDDDAPVLEIENLHISYWTRAGEIPAVMDFSMTVGKGESVGLVGESGCGKSTVALAIMNYMGNNGRIKSGTINASSPDEQPFENICQGPRMPHSMLTAEAISLCIELLAA